MAVWGALDRDDVFWLVGEHYANGELRIRFFT
jgi:hypothetical protein